MDEPGISTFDSSSDADMAIQSTLTSKLWSSTISSSASGHMHLDGGSADWGMGAADAPVVTDNRHIVIPLMSFVFGFPVLVITVLCVIQQRNKWLYERQHMRLQQQRRLSAASTIFSGFPTASRTLTGTYMQKDLSIYGPSGRGSIVITSAESPVPSITCAHRQSLSLHTIQQNGGHSAAGGGPMSSDQRSRKQSAAIRFTETMLDEEELQPAGKNTSRKSSYLHASQNQTCQKAPLLNVGPQNILDKFGYVDP